MKYTSAQIRKFIVGFVGAVLSAASAGLLPGPLNLYIASLIPFLTAIGIFATPNAPTTP